MENPDLVVQIEFWNGHLSLKKKYEKHSWHVTTKHNPCLWSNIGSDEKPWRSVYKEAIDAIKKWKASELSDEDFLHLLRYVAYGLEKRSFEDVEVVWPGNLSINHQPKLCVNDGQTRYTIQFACKDGVWQAHEKPGAEFYWPL